MSDGLKKTPRFATSFQDSVLKIALQDDYFAAQVIRYLSFNTEDKEYNIFNTLQHQIIFDAIAASIKKYNTRPSDAQVRQKIMEFSPEEQEALTATYERILNTSTHDEAYVRDNLKGYIQYVTLSVGLSDIRSAAKEDFFDLPNVMQKTIDQARRVNFEKEELLLLSNFDDIMASGHLDVKNLIPTLLPPLDADLLGGLPRGELVVILSGTNVGKSLFCITLGANALRSGKKVLHIQLEGRRIETFTRYVSNLAQVSTTQINKNEVSSFEKEKIKNAAKYEKQLQIRPLVERTISVEELAAKCREIYKDFKFDMLIVDYGALLTSAQKMDQYRLTQGHVHRELGKMANEFNCVVVTPAQGTRDSQKDQNQTYRKKNEDGPLPVLRSSDIAEAFEIARIAGVILTLNRTDEETAKGQMRIFLEKNRVEAKNKTYGVYTDYACARLITENFYDPNSVTENQDLFEEEEENDKVLFMQKKKDAEEKESLNKKVNRILAERMSIKGVIRTALENAEKESATMTTEQISQIKNFILEKEKELDEKTQSLKPLLQLLYPGATREMYELSVKSLEESKKDGTLSKADLAKVKEKVHHLKLLFEKKED